MTQEIKREKQNRDEGDLIINFTPTGMIPTKEMTPHVPVEVPEIVEAIHEALEIGITMVHIHAREPGSGAPTCSADIYAKIIEGVRKISNELILCVSLSGRTIKELERRAEPLNLTGNLKPDMGSLTLSSLNFNRQASINEPSTIMGLALRMKEKGIAPELEAFDAGMINYAHYLTKKGLIAPPYYFNLLLGNIACAQPDLLHAGVLIRDLPKESFYSIAGIGDHQLMMNSIAIAMGGGVRVGLEDNIWFDRGRTQLAGNADLLKRIHVIAGANDRKVMHPGVLRKQLNLENGTDGKFGLKSDTA
jgi:3-keto-5-aminohexanoate cleavage enzyme